MYYKGNNRFRRTGLTLTALALFSCLGWAQGAEKCDSFVTQQLTGRDGQWQQVIVKYSGAKDKALGKIKALGGDVYRDLSVINSFAVKVRNDRLRELLACPFVTRVSGDLQVKKNDLYTVSSSGADVAYKQYHLDGGGVGIAVVDSGISPLLTDMLLRVKSMVTFVPNSLALDDCGHGSAVAGIAAGNGLASSLLCSKTFYGIARNASLYSVKVLNAQGSGDVSNVIAGIQWVINNAKSKNIRVMNLSLGHPVGESYTTDPLCNAVEQAWKAGIVVVCAAGNTGRLQDNADPNLDNSGYGTNYGSIESPGNDPYVITVGAMKSPTGVRAKDTAASYSSRGPTRLDYILKPDIIAAGNQIITVEVPYSYLAVNYKATNEVPYSYYEPILTLLGTSMNYFKLSGTSMSAPVVSGAVALMLDKDKTLSPDTVKVRLMQSADKWGNPDGTADPFTYGAGYLNIPAALTCKTVAGQFVMSPSVSRDPGGFVSVNMDRAVWGNNSLWSTGTVNDNRAIWGQRAIWGNSTNQVDSSRAIWGNSFWSDSSTTHIDSGGVDLSVGSVTIQGER